MIAAVALSGTLALCSAVMAGYYSSQPGRGAARLGTVRFGGDAADNVEKRKERDALKDAIKKLKQEQAALEEELAQLKKAAADAEKQAMIPGRNEHRKSQELIDLENQVEALKRGAERKPSDIQWPEQDSGITALRKAWEDPSKGLVKTATDLLATRADVLKKTYEAAKANAGKSQVERNARMALLSDQLAGVKKELNAKIEAGDKEVKSANEELRKIMALIDTANRPKPGRDFINPLDMKMVWLGTYWMSEKEVTQEQLTKMGVADTSTWRKGEVSAPANNVTFNDAAAFCNKLTVSFPAVPGAYTLPTVDQWKSVNNPAIKDLEGGVSEWCFDAFSSAMVARNKAAGIANGQFMPPGFAGLRCVLGTSHLNASKDFAQGIWPQHMTAKGSTQGKTKDEFSAAGSIGNRLSAGEIGFRVVLVPSP